MHSAADYGSWFSPKMISTFCSWVCSRSDHVLTTNEPLQSSFESVPRPPLQAGLGTLVWSAFGAHPSAIAAFTPAQTNRTKGGNELWYDSTKLNEAGVKERFSSKVSFVCETDYTGCAGFVCSCMQPVKTIKWQRHFSYRGFVEQTWVNCNSFSASMELQIADSRFQVVLF